MELESSKTKRKSTCLFPKATTSLLDTDFCGLVSELLSTGLKATFEQAAVTVTSTQQTNILDVVGIFISTSSSE
ncbi:hypothetical protein D3C87_2175500 [compost metagenome]